MVASDTFDGPNLTSCWPSARFPVTGAAMTPTSPFSPVDNGRNPETDRMDSEDRGVAVSCMPHI